MSDLAAPAVAAEPIAPPVAPVLESPAVQPGVQPGQPGESISLRDRLAARFAVPGKPEPVAVPVVQPDVAPAPAAVEPGAPEPAPAVADPAEEGVEDNFSLDDDSAAINPEAELAVEAKTEPLSKEEADQEIGKLLATERGKRIYAAHKTMRALAEPESPDGSGGIGHQPTADQIKEYWHAHVGMQKLLSDFQEGNHQSIASWMFGQEAGPAAERFIAELPQHLSAVNPQLLRPLVNNVGAGISHSLRSMATRFPAEDQQRLLDAANVVDYIQGREVPQAAGQQEGASQTESPEVREMRARLQALEAERQREQQRSASFQHQQFVGAITSQVEQQLTTDVARALEIIKGKVPDVTYNAYANSLMQEARKAISRSPQVLDTIRIKVNGAASRNDAASIKGFVSEYRRLWADTVTDLRQEYIKAAGVKIRESRDATVAKLQQAQAKTAPAQAAPASSTPISAQRLVKQPGESGEAFFQRVKAARLGG